MITKLWCKPVFPALLLALAPGYTLAASDAQATGLRCEYLVNPLGLDVLQSRVILMSASDGVDSPLG